MEGKLDLLGMPEPILCSLHGDMYLPTWCKYCQVIVERLKKDKKS